MFFISDYRDPSKIDMVTYVGAHEIGHQWWAHQVIGADQQGGAMLSGDLRPVLGADGDEARLWRGARSASS
jgi:aminopeptidase N